MKLWKVNYQFVAPKGQLRGSSIVVDAKDASAAEVAAAAMIPTGHRWPKVVSVAAYVPSLAV